MYLKRIDGPRTVRTANGSVLSISDLPAISTRRWVASRKEAVVKAVFHGLLTREQAIERYALSEEELSLWESNYIQQGKNGLKTTRARSHWTITGCICKS